jgi:glycosyltransferase involved in cell wall biosynthesis
LARRLGFRDAILWAFLPTALPLARRLGPRALVYHCVDDYAANPGVSRDWIEELERRMLAVADVVFATSPVLGERLAREETRGAVRVVPNVADVELFRRALTSLPEPAALTGIPRPRAVYVGNLAAYRIDFSLLHAVVDAGAQLVLIGAVGLGDTDALPPAARALLDREGVTAVGSEPHPALPGYLAHCDVALVPFAVNEHTRGSLPLKLWEYLAAGLPVVATDLPNLRGVAEGDAAGAVVVAGSPEAFAAAVVRAAAEPASRRPERSELARAHDWPARMKELCGAVGGALASRDAARTLPEESG